MACENDPVLVGKDRIGPAKSPNAVDDLLNLFLGMGPRVSLTRAKMAERQKRDVAILHRPKLRWTPMLATIWNVAEGAGVLERYKKCQIGH